MKLIYLANIRIPTEKAHGTQIMKMCEAFANAGLEVELVLPKRFTPIQEDPFEHYNVERNFKIKKLPALDTIGKIPRFGFWLASLSFAVSTFFYLKKNKADIVYGRDELPLWVASHLNKNVFWETHQGQYSIATRWLLGRCRGVVGLTAGLRDFYIERGSPEDKFLIAADGVDLEEFKDRMTIEQARELTGLPKDKKIAMYRGHLYDWKGPSVLAEAAPLLPEVLMVFVGGTEEDVAKFKAKYGHLPNVLLTGNTPHNTKSAYLQSADVLVLPSSGEKEISRSFTSPLKLFQYMAAERPIVASDVPSSREVLNENNSVLFKADSHQDLAESIKKVLNNSDFASSIAQAAYRDAQRYTWQARVTSILSFMHL